MIKPLGDRVVILPAKAETETKGGIIIPDTSKEKPLWQLVPASSSTMVREQLWKSKLTTMSSLINIPAQKSKSTMLSIS